MDYKQVEGRSDLFRDTDSGAIVNTDRSAYLAYKAKKEQRLNEMGRIDKLQNEIYEIKSLLYKVIDKLKLDKYI